MAVKRVPDGFHRVTPHLTVRNASADVDAAVLIDGRESGALSPGASLSIGLGEQRSLLATLPETTFFSRYRETFTA